MVQYERTLSKSYRWGMDLLMILVTLGTQDKSFVRLLKALDKAVKKGKIKEKILVQAGCTEYKSKNMEIFDLTSPEELDKLVKKCSLLITHGGVGSILNGIKYNKPIIAAARLSEYKEHTNDHQKQIIKEFVKNGYILELEDFDNLDKLIKQAKKFKPKKFESNTNKFIKNIEDYIKEDNHTSWFNKLINLLSSGYRTILGTVISILIFNSLILNTKLIPSLILSILTIIVFNLLMIIITRTNINKKKYLINNIICFIIDFCLTYLFIYNINIEVIVSKIIVSFIVLITSYGISKMKCLQ